MGRKIPRFYIQGEEYWVTTFEWKEYLKGQIKFSCVVEIFKKERDFMIEMDRMLWRKSLGEYEYIGWLKRPKNSEYVDYLKSIKTNKEDL